MTKKHTLSIPYIVAMVDDGLLIGNGDLSASFYQQPGRLIWRFGKGDVWDRRVDYELDNKPPHIREMIRGIRDERWCCGPYGGEVKALNGTDNPERMKEICQGVPPSHTKRGYPCPKPVGELIMHYPLGVKNFRIEQTLEIERGILRAKCSWAGGVKLELSAFIAPENNLFAVSYALKNYTADVAMGEDYVAPIYFSLVREADKSAAEFAIDYNRVGSPIFPCFETMGGTPMGAPTVEKLSENRSYLEQLLPPEATYPEGLRCGVAFQGEGFAEKSYPANANGAMLDYAPTPPAGLTGTVTVAVETAPERAELCRKLLATLAVNPGAARQECTRAAAEFWAKSGIDLPEEPLAELVWYANLHARRIAYRKGFLPPGLVFPSTVGHYSLWHGDFHMNYNFQQPFYGDYMANHPEIGDSYFDAMKPILQLGKLIAERYYDSTGTFIQLSGYPIRALDDILGCAPMGRMIYGTGWAGHQYFWRYLYTQDKDFLRETGYPVLKSLAQFYLDFLTLEEDGKYHAFPSNQGEDGFTGDPEAYRDLPQIMLHIRFALCVAEFAARELHTDEEFQAQCRDRIEHLADMKMCANDIRKARDNWDEVSGNLDGHPTRPWSAVTAPRGDFFPPEFLGFDGMVRTFGDRENPPWKTPDFYCRRWYAGKFPSVWLTEFYNDCFVPDRDWKYVRKILDKWLMPNGLIRAMALPMYGPMGAFTETTGMIAPITACLLDARGAVMRLFPGAPRSWKNAAFSKLRAAGGFLVSAQKAGGKVVSVTIVADADEARQVQLENPFGKAKFQSNRNDFAVSGKVLALTLKKGQVWKLVSNERIKGKQR